MATALVFNSYVPLPTNAKYYTLKDDSVYYDCSAAKSIAFVDMQLYRARLYRNELPVGYSGVPIEAGLLTPAADDRLNATPPHDEQYKDSMMGFMTEANGTGNCIAFIRQRDFEGFHSSIPTRF